MKKRSSKHIKKLAEALQRKKQKGKPRGNPQALAPYRFKPGTSGNPSGRPPVDHARDTVNRLAHTSPPPKLCAQIGVQTGCTWVEAIVFALGTAAMNGDVSAAREILTNLGLRGATGDTNVINVTTDPAKMGQYQRFVHETRWVPEAELEKLWQLCRALAVPPAGGAQLLLPTEEEENETD